LSKICLDYYSRNLVSFKIRGDETKVFQRVSMNLNITVGQTACQLLCRYTQSTLTASCVCWILPTVTCATVPLSKELVAVHVWDAPDQWHNWRVAGM